MSKYTFVIFCFKKCGKSGTKFREYFALKMLKPLELQRASTPTRGRGISWGAFGGLVPPGHLKKKNKKERKEKEERRGKERKKRKKDKST